MGLLEALEKEERRLGSAPLIGQGPTLSPSVKPELSFMQRLEKAESGLIKPAPSVNRLVGALGEGLKDIVRAPWQLAKGASITALGEEHGLSEYIAEVAGAPVIKTGPEYEGESSGWVEDFVRAAPQMGAQLLYGGIAAAVAGPQAGFAVSMAVMGPQIAGSTYENLKAQGASDERATAYGISNAIMQAPLEAIGISRFSKMWKPQKQIAQRLKDIGEVMGVEWLTEFLQAFPDSAVNIFALNPDKSVLDRTQQFLDDAWETAQQGAYEGTLTAPWALLGLTGPTPGPKPTLPPTPTEEAPPAVDARRDEILEGATFADEVIRRQAREKALIALETDPEYQKLLNQNKRHRASLELQQKTWDAAVAKGKEPSEALEKAIIKTETKIADTDDKIVEKVPVEPKPVEVAPEPVIPVEPPVVEPAPEKPPVAEEKAKEPWEMTVQDAIEQKKKDVIKSGIDEKEVDENQIKMWEQSHVEAIANSPRDTDISAKVMASLPETARESLLRTHPVAASNWVDSLKIWNKPYRKVLDDVQIRAGIGDIKKMHKKAVQQAHTAGKDIPVKVQEEYPDLFPVVTLPGTTVGKVGNFYFVTKEGRRYEAPSGEGKMHFIAVEEFGFKVEDLAEHGTIKAEEPEKKPVPVKPEEAKPVAIGMVYIKDKQRPYTDLRESKKVGKVEVYVEADKKWYTVDKKSLRPGPEVPKTEFLPREKEKRDDKYPPEPGERGVYVGVDPRGKDYAIWFLEEGLRRQVRPDTIKILKPETKTHKATQALARAFKLKTVFWKTTDPTIKVDGFYNPQLPDTIFVRFDADKPLFLVAGHELIHSLKANHPDLYDFLDTSIKQDVVNFNQYLKGLNFRREVSGAEPATYTKGFEELYADFCGDQFTNKDFWDKLSGKSPTLTKRLMDVVKRILKKLRDFSGLYKQDQYFADIEKAQTVLADVLGEYSRRQLKGKVEAKPGLPTEMQTKALSDYEKSENFKKWFGKSKVVDKKGKPLAVYHGTYSKFTEFDKEKIQLGQGFFFSPSKGYAKHFAGDTGILMSVYLRIINPLNLDTNKGMAILDQLRAKAKKNNTTEVEEAEKAGYDGYFSEGGLKHGGAIIAFKPTQIKSVFNIGTWSGMDPDIRFSYAGRKALTADVSMLDRAVAREQEGEDAGPDSGIRRDTGWFIGMDDMWRYEIDDSKMKMGKQLEMRFKAGETVRGELGGLIDHKELFKAYPDLENLDITINIKNKANLPEHLIDDVARGDATGTFDGKSITVNASSPNAVKQTLIHEVQHAVQEIEGFARGGSPGQFGFEDVSIRAEELGVLRDKLIKEGAPERQIQEARDAITDISIGGETYLYKRLAGEIEAREVAGRMKMTPEERKATPPYYSQGIPREQAIVRFKGMEALATEFLMPEEARKKGKPTLPAFINELSGTKNKTWASKITEPLKDAWENRVTRFLDRLHPIKTWLGDRAYMLARVEPSVQTAIEMMMRHGILKKDPSGTFAIDETVPGFLEWYEKQGIDAYKMLWWRVANRAKILEGQDRENWITEDKRKEIFDWTKDKPDKYWQDLSDQFEMYHQSVLSMASDFGIMNPQWRKEWTEDFYIPFFRIMEDQHAKEEILKGPVPNKKHIDAKIKKLIGAEKKIGDPLENVLRNWSHLIHESIRNEARAEAFDSAKRLNLNVIEEVKKKDLTRILGSKTQTRYAVMGENSKKASNLFDDKEEADAWAYHLSGKYNRSYRVEPRKTTVTLFGQMLDHGILSFLRKGERVYFRVNDPELFNALSNVNAKNFDNTIMRMFSLAKRTLTYTATFGPAFRIANMLRDTLQAFVISKSFKPFWDTGKGIVKAMREDSDYVKMMASLGGFRSGYVKADDPAALKKYIDRIVHKEGRGAAARILDTPKKLLDLWEKIGSASENAARVMIFSKMMKKENPSTLEAAFESRDFLDFMMRGDAAAVQFIIQMVPFMNARIQGLYKVGRAAVEGPEEEKVFGAIQKSFATKGAMLAAASLIIWFSNKDREEWKELEDWDKWFYHHFWIGPFHFRIPKGFETGAIFSTAFESAAEVMSGNEELGYLLDTAKAMAFDTFALNPTPQLIKPIMEQWANKSMFTGRPIEPQRLKGLVPGERADIWTSETMQLAGKLGISPKRAEALIQGYFSTVGMSLLGISDAIIHHIGDFPSDPKKRIGDYPAWGRFMKERATPRQSKYLTRFYDTMEEFDQLVGTINYCKRVGDFDKARKLMEKNRQKLIIKKPLNKVRSDLRKINANIRLIYHAKISPERKKQALIKWIKQRNESGKRAYKIIMDANIK